MSRAWLTLPSCATDHNRVLKGVAHCNWPVWLVTQKNKRLPGCTLWSMIPLNHRPPDTKTTSRPSRMSPKKKGRRFITAESRLLTAHEIRAADNVSSVGSCRTAVGAIHAELELDDPIQVIVLHESRQLNLFKSSSNNQTLTISAVICSRSATQSIAPRIWSS